MLKKVINVIKELKLIEENDRIVVGVSGGPDSMCLISILKKISEEKLLGFSFELFVCHINHGTRNGASDDDAKFVEDYCLAEKIPFYVYSYNLQEEATRLDMSQEEAGRHLRYDAFRDVMRKVNANKIATAHNLDDNVETVFLNLLRGTGLTGLTGIKSVNDMIIRPLLSVEKKEILSYLNDNAIKFVLDYTNSETVYTRNKIRNLVFPIIRNEVNENFLNLINNTINILNADEMALDSISENEFERLVISKSEDEILLNYQELLGLNLAIKRRVIRMAIKSVNNNSLKDISLRYVDKIINLIPGKELNLPFNLRVYCMYGELKICKCFSKNDCSIEPLVVYDELDLENSSGNIYYDFQVMSDGLMSDMVLHYEVLDVSNIDLKEIKSNKNKFLVYFDLDKVKGKVIIRNRIDGDKIIIDDDGHIKKIKDILIDAKADKIKRDFVLIIEDKGVDSETSSAVMDVLGYRWNPYYKIDSSTKRVLKVWQSNA